MLLSKAFRALSFVALIAVFIFSGISEAKTAKKKKRKAVKHPKFVEAYANNLSGKARAEQRAGVSSKRYQERVKKAEIVVTQVRRAKTVKAFVEKGPKALKVKRRFFLGKSYSRRLPYVVADGPRVHMFDDASMQKGMTLSFYERKDGRTGMKLRGRDITPKRGEKDRRWMKRVAKVIKAKPRRKRRKSALLQLIHWVLPKAFADESTTDYLPVLYAAFEALNVAGQTGTEALAEMSAFRAQYGISSGLFNDLQRWEGINASLRLPEGDPGRISAEEVEQRSADFNSPNVCVNPPFSVNAEGRQSADTLAGARNIPLPDDPELLAALGVDPDGDQNYISVYPTRVTSGSGDRSRELDIIITENPIASQETLFELDPTKRPSVENGITELGDGNAVLSRTRIDFNGETPSYEYPMSETACANDTVYSFSRLAQGAEAQSYCGADGAGDRLAKADRGFFMCSQAMEFDCKMPLFGLEDMETCWSGESDGFEPDPNTRACMRQIFAGNGPSEGAEDRCGTDASAVPADELAGIDRAIASTRNAIVNEELMRLMLRETDDGYEIRGNGPIRADRYEAQKRRTLGALIENIEGFGNVSTQESYDAFMAAFQAAHPEQYEAAEAWLNQRLEAERERLVAEAVQQPTLQGDNTEQFFEVRRQLLLMMAQQTQAAYSGGLVSGDADIWEPVRTGETVTVDQAIEAMNSYVFLEDGTRRSLAALSGRDEEIKISDFCPRGERNCRATLETMFAENGLNDVDVLSLNARLDMAGDHAATNSVCTDEEVPETGGKNIEDEIQAVNATLEATDTESLVDPSRRLLSYVTAVTSICRAFSFNSMNRPVGENEEVDPALIREGPGGTQMVPVTPQQHYQTQ